MENQEAQISVLQDLLSTLQDHDGGRVRPTGGVKLPQPKKEEPAQEIDAADMDPRLLKLLRDK